MKTVAFLLLIGFAAAVPTSLAPVSASPESCFVCKELVQVLEKEIDSNTTVSDVEKLVENACALIIKHVPAAKGACEAVEQEVPTLIQMLISAESPEKVCQEAKQCSSDVAPVAIEDVELDKCAVCEEIVSLAEGELEKNSTVQEIKALVTEACDFVEEHFPSIKSECTLIEDNIETILKALLNKEDPKAVCTQVSLCSGAGVKAFMTAFKPVREDVGLDKCALCEEIAEIAEQELEKNATVQEIKELVTEACDFIESKVPSIKPECTLIEASIESILKAILNKEDPKTVCTQLSLCSGSFLEPVASTALATVSIDKCLVCEEAVSIIDTELKQNATEQEIKSLVTKGCSAIEHYVPQVKIVCDFIEGDIDNIIDQVTKMSPKAVCSKVNLCSTAGPRLLTAVKVAAHPQQLPAGEQCTLCEELITIAEGKLETNATEEEIKTLVEDGCAFAEKYVPQVKAECALIEQNIPSIIKAIVAKETPKALCTTLGLCVGDLPVAMDRLLPQ